MIPLMSLMIGAYIVTRMMIFILDQNPSQYELGIVVNKSLAAATILITIVCVILILFPSIGFLDMENMFKSNEPSPGARGMEWPLSSMEEPKSYLVITKPAELYRSDFKTVWKIDRIPIGMKLEIFSDHVWHSSITKLKIVFYKVKYKGIHGWVMEDNCKIII